MEELSAMLNKMADLDDELKQVKTKHEMTAKQNADMIIKLQVQTHDCASQCIVLQICTIVNAVLPGSCLEWRHCICICTS